MRFAFMLFSVVTCLASAEETPERDLFAGFSAAEFQECSRAQQVIQIEQIDVALLSASAFHATNLQREKAGLPALRHDSKVLAAAQMQAEIMAARGSISHDNPELPEKNKLQDRLRLAGIVPSFAAENVATAFGLNYRASDPVYVREENGRKVFSREPNGEALPGHTYLSFAAALLDSWMASPHHHKNVVTPEAEFAAVSCRPGANAMGMPVFYCAQVLFAPKASAPPAGK